MITHHFISGLLVSDISFYGVYSFRHAFVVLDPQISYDGLQQDYIDDASLLAYLDSTKSMLHAYYTENYANREVAGTKQNIAVDPSHSQASGGVVSKMNFTSRYKKKDNVLHDELEEYFKLPREDFESCDLLTWWLGRHAQYPNLFRLACDVLAIPGIVSDLLTNKS
jgi:hypothetical protein